MSTALSTAVPPVTVPAVVDGRRLEVIEEAADLAILFLVGVRQAARDSDVTKTGACLRALWTATLTMRQAFHEIGAERGDAGGTV